MGQYIDKAAVVAEIKRYKHKAHERLKIKGRTLAEDCKDSALQNLCGNLLHFLDTLELKEVDLDKELKNLDDTLFDLDGVAVQGATSYLTVEDVKDIAKHFFELGIKAQKG